MSKSESCTPSYVGGCVFKSRFCDQISVLCMDILRDFLNISQYFKQNFWVVSQFRQLTSFASFPLLLHFLFLYISLVLFVLHFRLFQCFIRHMKVYIHIVIFQVFKIKFLYVLLCMKDLKITKLSKYIAISHNPAVRSIYSNGSIECTAVELQ